MQYLFIVLFSITLFSQQYKNVDFRSVAGKIEINPEKKQVSGKVIYDFEVLQMVDTIYIDAQSMTFENVFVNDKKVDFKNSKKKLAFYQNYNLGINSVSFDFVANPKQAIYFNNFDDNWQIWTQGQGKYTSHWFPSFDDVNEKLVFNLDISFDKDYQVISNGILVNDNNNSNQNINLKMWKYRMQQPMSSYLLMLAIGKYENKILKSKSGIPLQLFIEPEDKLKFEPTYRHSKKIFDFFEKEIGVKYPWQVYKQIPVRDFLYAGMENTSATIFSREFVVDSVAFNDRNYIDVNAHELAHQWFGNLVTAKSGQHHWLQEGFATYYALLAEKEILGEDYFYNILYEFTKEFKISEKTDATPVLNEKASSMTFYKKGAWALFILENEIGEKTFKKSVKNYLKKYGFKTVETDNFLDEIRKISDFDAVKFKKEWLESSIFDFEKANILLSKNKTLAQLFDLKKLREIEIKEKYVQFETILKSDAYYTIKEEILIQLSDLTYDLKRDLLIMALNTKDLKVRQALASTLTEIRESFRLKYESLLKDKSYKTKEIALTNLIDNFPDESRGYLSRTKNIEGFNDKGFEMMWMIIALTTPSYNLNRDDLLLKLSNYTCNKYEFSVRQNAFININKIKHFNDKNLQDLLECCQLPNWRSAKWSKDFLKSILKEEKIKSDYQRILPTLSEINQLMLKRFM
ncbi:MAG: M1 family metallopeptidase [Flavobacterium sp.]|nr:M1 family metallopeptidase [Flavobacterium sp.]